MPNSKKLAIKAQGNGIIYGGIDIKFAIHARVALHHVFDGDAKIADAAKSECAKERHTSTIIAQNMDSQRRLF